MLHFLLNCEMRFDCWCYSFYVSAACLLIWKVLSGNQVKQAPCLFLQEEWEQLWVTIKKYYWTSFLLFPLRIHWKKIIIIFNLSRVTSWLLLSSWLQVELLIPQLQFLDDEGAQAELWELSRLFVDTLIEETGSQVSWKCCFKLNKFSLRVSTLIWW